MARKHVGVERTHFSAASPASDSGWAGFHFQFWQLLLLLLLNPLVAQADSPPTFAWVRQASSMAAGGNSGEVQIADIAADSAGEIYLTGWFYGAAVFGTTTLLDADLADMFLAKYSSSGQLLWVQSAGGQNACQGVRLAVGPAGDAYVIGRFEGTANFGPTNLLSQGSQDVFVAKYGPSGSLAWVRQVGGSAGDVAEGITVDVQENVYLAGNFFLPAGTNNLAGACFVAKFDRDGNQLWALNSPSGTAQAGTRIGLDGASGVYLTGWFRGMATIGTNGLSNGDSHRMDGFVARLTSDGAVTWVQQVGSSARVEISALGVDPLGNALLTGGFLGTLSIGSSNTASLGSEDAFLAKFAPNGTLLWVRSAGGVQADLATGLAVDSAGSVILTGYFRSAASFGTNQLLATSSASANGFTTRVSTSGEFLWSVQTSAGTTGSTLGSAVAVGVNGAAFVAGIFSEAWLFETNSLTATGSFDGFLLRLEESAPSLSLGWANGSIVLRWPSSAVNFSLQSAMSLSPGQVWMPAAEPISTNAQEKLVTMPANGGARFFRLIRR